MAMPLNALLFLGVLAVLTAAAMFLDWDDGATRIVFAFASSILWGAFGLSSFSVNISDANPGVTEPIYPLAYLGVAFAVMTFPLSVLWLLQFVGQAADETSLDSVGR